MLERLELTKNAQFFTLKDTEHGSIEDHVILDVLNASDDNIEPEEDYILNEFRVEKTLIDRNVNYRYSVRVFPTIRPVYFISNSDVEDVYYDRVYAFVIILEFDSSIAVIKKSCANITDKIERYFDLVTSAAIADTFNDADVSFQRISLRNMTVSDKAIRNRSYEAPDLKGTFSTHAAGRSIPLFLKFRQGAAIKTISGTGRLVETSQRINFDNISVWTYNQLLLIKNGGGEKDFLDAFAKQKKLHDVLEQTSPNAILIESSSLYDQLLAEGLKVKYSNRRNIEVELKDKDVARLIKYLERVFIIDSNKNIITKVGKACLKVNNKTLRFDSSFLRALKVNVSGSDVTLQSYIIKNGFYSITFNKPCYMYFIGNCFEDASGVSEINSILDMLTPIKDIESVISEKGKFRTNSVKFSKESIFHVVETFHKEDDYIFCDDLGNEWADHITFNNKKSCISFIHSKHGASSTSASNLHDVVGQAVKNLGYMHFTQKDFEKKLDSKFKLKYKSSKGETNIDRIRKGDVSLLSGYLEILLKDFRLHRKCILSCSFLSKAIVKEEFEKISRGEQVNGHITQLLWILSSFSHAVKEVGAIPIVYCSE